MGKAVLESARWLHLTGGVLISPQHAMQGVVWFLRKHPLHIDWATEAVKAKFDAIQKYTLSILKHKQNAAFCLHFIKSPWVSLGISTTAYGSLQSGHTQIFHISSRTKTDSISGFSKLVSYLSNPRHERKKPHHFWKSAFTASTSALTY